MTNEAHILVVDDDREIRDLLARFLVKHGLRVTAARDGVEMTKALENHRIDLVVLDLMLPGEGGLSLCRKIRATSPMPVIKLTAMGEETDRIVGLEMGADDYMAKPFNPRELLARIKAVLRRAPADKAEAPAARYRFGQFTLDPGARTLADEQGQPIELTAGEFDLLLALVERPQRVLTRDQLLDLTRGREAGPFDRAIDIQVSRLRRKIEADPADPALIKTVRGGGYMLAVKVDRS
jgi:two-component system OmpR family response regulator